MFPFDRTELSRFLSLFGNLSFGYSTRLLRTSKMKTLFKFAQIRSTIRYTSPNYTEPRKSFPVEIMFGEFFDI